MIVQQHVRAGAPGRVVRPAPGARWYVGEGRLATADASYVYASDAARRRVAARPVALAQLACRGG
jgi:hypothetical protein